MNNNPLSSRQQGSVLIFLALLIPPTFIGLGVIPIVFLLFGTYMMKKNKDFRSLEAVIKGIKIYLILVALGAIVVAVGAYINLASDLPDETVGGSIIAVLSICYLIMLDFLFYKPLKANFCWVESNGIFITKENVVEKKSPNSVATKNSNSISDELLKLANLKESGYLSDDEFTKAKAELLNK